MRKIKEVLRLHYELQLNQRQIARSCGIGQATVHDYLQRAEAAGVGWPLPEDWDESQLQAKLFGPATVGTVEPPRSCPDFAAVREQMQRVRVGLPVLFPDETQRQMPDAATKASSPS